MTEIDKPILGGGGSTQSNSIDPKTSVLSGYSLSTSAQTIVGAINEILPKVTGVGKVDPNSNGTGEVFNGYEGYYANVASGNYSHAEGGSTTASGYYSHAEGNNTNASGDSSHAEGYNTNASGDSSHAEGYKTNASGNSSHAEGFQTNASGYSSHAEGYSSSARGEYSHAEGYKTKASGDRSHAEGNNTNASGYSSHAEGYYTQTFSWGEHAEGSYNKSYDSDDVSVRVIHSVGIGPSWDDRKNAHEIKFNGDHYIYGLGGFDGTNSDTAQTLQEVINSKQETITAGTGLEFEGNTLNVTLDTTVFKVVSALPDSPAAGDENKIHLVPAESTGTNNIYTEYVWVNSAWEILGEYTSEVDLTPYLKIADAADIYLSKTDATSTYLTKTDASSTYLAKTAAVGKIDSTSDGTGEVFNCYKGKLNVASGELSHAEGAHTTAKGNCSHAEGYYTIASGEYSHVEGAGTTATGEYSHAEGRYTKTIGSYSHAEGYYTEAHNFYEHAEGSYNISNTGDTEDLQTRHSVGIGTTSINRKNAHEIMVNGDHYIYGIGGYDGKNATANTSSTLQQIINSLFNITVDLRGYDSVMSNNGDGFKIADLSDQHYINGADIFIKDDDIEGEIKYFVVEKNENMAEAINFNNGNTFEYTQEYGLKRNGDELVKVYARYGKYSTEEESKWWLMRITPASGGSN